MRCASCGPVRVQRKRTKGWRMPPDTIYVGRGTQWGNVHRPGCGPCCHDAGDAVRLFRADVERGEYGDLAALRGKNLACWCRLDQPCHADVLLEFANA